MTVNKVELVKYSLIYPELTKKYLDLIEAIEQNKNNIDIGCNLINIENTIKFNCINNYGVIIQFIIFYDNKNHTLRYKSKLIDYNQVITTKHSIDKHKAKYINNNNKSNALTVFNYIIDDNDILMDKAMLAFIDLHDIIKSIFYSLCNDSGITLVLLKS